MQKYIFFFILTCGFISFCFYRADKKQRQKTTQKKVKMGIRKKSAVKHTIFSRKKVKNKKKKT